MTEARAKRLVMSFRAAVPPQWTRFVEEYPLPQQCDTTFPGERVIYTNLRWRLMCAVQREINEIMAYTGDSDGDHWQIMLDGGKGDCEDYALTKRTLLIEAGFPPGCLWPVMCKKDAKGHMVLVVATSTADFVLDFDPDWITKAHERQVDLKWLSAFDGMGWRLISLV